MKRLVFCFDGTNSALGAVFPTNVVLTAASINRVGVDGVAQVIYYDEGVGTGNLDGQSHLLSGAFDLFDKAVGGGVGLGLSRNIREAYRFLIFNYDPGDEIFVFGFSRGAFTARSFIGLIRHVGPIRRLCASQIDNAISLYHQRIKGTEGSSEKLRLSRAENSSNVLIDEGDEEWRVRNIPGYEKGSARPMRIKYLGVWDTVSAIGAPEALPGSTQINHGLHFHDPSITSFVEHARHAVAIDEQRILFPPVPFGSLVELNQSRGFNISDPDAPYQERWFPGDHGSVGGGGDIRGLSDGALEWVLFGAKRAGLSLDVSADTRIYKMKPDPYAKLVNISAAQNSLLDYTIYKLKRPRQGPTDISQLSMSALRRCKAESSELPEKRPYRPEALINLRSAIDQFVMPGSQEVGELIATHTVQPGETLYSIAKLFYDDQSKFGKIFAANRHILDDYRQLSVGQVLRIPQIG